MIKKKAMQFLHGRNINVIGFGKLCNCLCEKIVQKKFKLLFFFCYVLYHLTCEIVEYAL